MSKVIQLIPTDTGNTGFQCQTFIALCEDGSIWHLHTTGNLRWLPIAEFSPDQGYAEGGD